MRLAQRLKVVNRRFFFYVIIFLKQNYPSNSTYYNIFIQLENNNIFSYLNEVKAHCY